MKLKTILIIGAAVVTAAPTLAQNSSGTSNTNSTNTSNGMRTAPVSGSTEEQAGSRREPVEQKGSGAEATPTATGTNNNAGAGGNTTGTGGPGGSGNR